MPMQLRNGRNLSITSGITTILSTKAIHIPYRGDNPQMVNAYKNEIVTYMRDRSVN